MNIHRDPDPKTLPFIDTSRPNIARMYDYYLGGKNNFAADREAAERVVRATPNTPAAARGNRQFLKNAVAHAARAGVRQFIDLGPGLPTAENTHEVAHGIDPGIKVAYVDYDPQVVSHARALLQKGYEETVLIVDGDLREPEVVTGLLRHFIDFTQPVGIMMVAVVHFIEAPECYRLVNTWKGKMAPGSHLILSHATADFLSPAESEGIASSYQGASRKIFLRPVDDIRQFFSDLKLLDPGVVNVEEWPEKTHVSQSPIVCGGVGLKEA